MSTTNLQEIPIPVDLGNDVMREVGPPGGSSRDHSDVPRTHSFGSLSSKKSSLMSSQKVQSDYITKEIMERSLSVLGHNSQGQVIFSCSTLNGMGLLDISMLSGYRFLQKILLNDNKLTTLDALRPLNFLVYLSVSNNALTDGCFDCLLSCAANLEHLQVNNNKLTSLKGLHQLPYLVNFSASGNQITELIPENFSTAKSLMRVQLGGNKIQRVEPQTFSGSQYIRLLDLSHNQITDMMFTSYITENLESLYISDNRVTRLGSSLAQCKMLVLLDMKNNLLETIEELQNLCPAPGLRKLYVTGNPFRETKEMDADTVEMKMSQSELAMDDTQPHEAGANGTGTSAMELSRKKLKSPNLPYAALTARHTYGRIRSVVAAANVINIPSCTDKRGELRRMPLETQARLRILNILPQLTILNGVLVTSEDVARSIAYFEEETPYFPNQEMKTKAMRTDTTSAAELSSTSISQELRTPPAVGRRRSTSPC